MGGKKPGTICVTTADDNDAGTLQRQRCSPPGGIGQGKSVVAQKTPRVTFSALWEGYPGSKPYKDAKTGEVPKGYENQCAIKVSVALHAAGIAMKSFRGAAVTLGGKNAAIRATEMAAWLKTQHIDGMAASPVNVTGENWQDTIKGKSGIVYFADYWAREGGEKTPTGDHIDLWNGSRMTASGFEGTVVTLLRFSLGVNAGPGFSDLGKAKTILFWEVK